MSSSYLSQPLTRGKVILHTSAGDLEIELWPKEAPLACRNFVQLCLEGYYDNCLFHRIIKNFIVQGGDPTGNGGESIYGKPFKDEFHSRLRFSHRGILAMAGSNNTNNSQFFITLDQCHDLDKKHTIFGKVVGDTIYNLLRLGELETDENERPLYPAMIKSTTVVVNPFDDIIPRVFEKPKPVEIAKEEETKPKPRKNLALLSFEEDESQGFKPKIKALPGQLEPPPRVFETAPPVSVAQDKPKRPIEDVDFDTRMKAKVLKAKEKIPSAQDQVEMLKKRIKQLDQPEFEKKTVAKNKKLSLVEEMRQQYLQGKAVPSRKKLKDQDSLLESLESFSEKIRDAQTIEPKTKKDTRVEIDEEQECDLHFIKGCESCKDTFGANIEDDNDQGWMSASLVFKKEVGANVYQPKVDDYTVEDPRQGIKNDIFGRDLKAPDVWKDKSLRHGKKHTNL